MNQGTVDLITQIATIAVPAIVAFFAGRHNIIMNPVKPSTPVEPDLPIGKGGLLQLLQRLFSEVSKATPAVPAPVNPSDPVTAPIGQGGLLQVVSKVLQEIMAHKDSTPQQKAEAASAVVAATANFVEK